MSMVICLLIYTIGLLKEIRPSDIYFFEYVLENWKNIDLNINLLMIGRYSYIAQLVLVFLITDFCRYTPLITFLAISGIIVRTLLLWGTTFSSFIILQLFYGTYAATEIAYYTYLYSKVKVQYYSRVTAFSRAAVLAGKCISGLSGQLLISYNVTTTRDLNYISFAAIIAAFICAFYLSLSGIRFPKYETRQLTSNVSANTCSKLGKRFVESYKNINVLKLSLWWIMSTAGLMQVQMFVSALWHHKANYNTNFRGADQAVLAGFAFFATLNAAISIKIWKSARDIILTIGTLASGGLILGGVATDSVIGSYICYVIFFYIHHYISTVVSAEIAKEISEGSYGLIFGFNTFIAIIIHTFFLLICITGDLGPILSLEKQYMIYGIYHFVVASLYAITALFIWVYCHRK